MTTGCYKTINTIPQIFVDTKEDNTPLGHYGCELLTYMQRNYPDRYLELSFTGRLTGEIHKREKEIMDLKIEVMQKLEKQSPRPKTQNFSEIAEHMNKIAEQAENILKQEFHRPI